MDLGIWVPSARSFNTGSTDNRLDYYVADLVEVTDYNPGGMPMPGRSVPDMQLQGFKWGYNGQHNDD